MYVACKKFVCEHIISVTLVPTCPPLSAPANGRINCSLENGEANPGDTCTFTCDDGYELGGSTSRTCGDDGSWSGTDTTCTRGTRFVHCIGSTLPLHNLKMIIFSYAWLNKYVVSLLRKTDLLF